MLYFNRIYFFKLCNVREFKAARDQLFYWDTASLQKETYFKTRKIQKRLNMKS